MARFISIRTKLISLTVISIALPFAVIGTYTYIEYSNRVEALSRQYSEGLLRQVAVGIERFLKVPDELSLTPLYDNELIAMLKHRSPMPAAGAPPPIYSTVDLRVVMRYLASLRFDRNEVHSVEIFAKDGVRFSYSDYFSSGTWEPGSRAWMTRAQAAMGAQRVIPAESMESPPGEYRNFISVVRLLREPFAHEPLGFIRVAFSSHNLEQAIFPSLVGRADYRLLVYNAQEELIYPETIAPLSFVEHSRLLRYNGKDYLASAFHSDNSAMTLYGLVPFADVAKEAQTLTFASGLIAVIALIMAVFLSILRANRIVSPLRQLAGHIGRVREGRFDLRADSSTNDEIGVLAEDFNLMTQEIGRLINEIYRVSLKEQEAEIMLLQSQMNPHFLYNTLETISMMAVERNRLDISDMVTKLGQMLRYSSTGSASRVPLSSELAFAENYMAIQTLRLGDRVSLLASVGPAFAECLVPRLCLQPFVENVIDHALLEGPVRVEIGTFSEAGILVITISDDGKGLSEADARSLEDRIRRPDDGAVEIIPFGTVRRGIALRNIHLRIVLLHGPTFGLSVSPRPGRGSVFSIRVPFDKALRS